jgi:hypothetical protein
MRFNHILKLLPVVGVLAVALLFKSCNLRVSAMGYQNRIFIFADSLLWSEIGEEITQIFEKDIYTPHVEKSFFVTWQPLEKLGGFKDRMNVFFAGVDNEETPVNEYIKKSLPQEVLEQMRNNERFYVFADDMFAKGQIGMFMFAKDRKSFMRNLERVKENMFERFNEKYFARLKKEIYSVGEQEDLEKTLASNFGWKVRVQHDYFIANQNPEEKYVWLRRMRPDRWLSAWRVKGDSSLVNRDSLIRIRNRMTDKYYQGDTVEEQDTYMEVTRLNDYKATKLVGCWRNDSLLVGGPFRMYAVYEPSDSALYCVDLAVMAPGQNKKPYLDQLEVIANTFEIVNDSEKQ